MSARARWDAGIPIRIFLIVSSITAVAALVVAARRATAHRPEPARSLPVGVVMAATEPIAAEAHVFRFRSTELAIQPTTDRARPAHPRTLATYRSLRAYPGAPPRIPHGLTPNEFRSGGCRTCHERGGFSLRFGAYVPLTPHAEMGACLQCHTGDAALMAIPLPNLDRNARCLQCHTPDPTLPPAGPKWATMAWPAERRSIPDREPPPIPHDLGMRGNCLACHAAPAGVVEIRTRHTERANCRQCHVMANDTVPPFERSAPPLTALRGGPS